MRRYILIFLVFISFAYNLFAKDFTQKDNQFSTFLFMNKNFTFIDSSFNFQKKFNERLKNFSLKSIKLNNLSSNNPYSLKYNFSIPKGSNLSVNLRNLENEKITLDLNKKEFINIKEFSFDFKQFWRYNISTTVSYFYKKYSNFRLLKTNVENYGYSINISKYLKSNKFSISYEDIDLGSKKTYEDIYITSGEKNKLTLSYQLNLNKNFSMVFMYSLTKFNLENNNNDKENFFYTGIKYKFNFFNPFK